MELVLFLLKRKIGEFYVNSGALQDFSRSLRGLVEQRKSYCVYFVSRKMLSRAAKQEDSSAALFNADMLIPGSRWVARSLRWHYSIKAEKISRQQLTDTLLEALPWNMVCFYGEDNRQLRLLTEKYPEITAIHPQANPLSADTLLNKGGFSLILVCLPETEQLQWMNAMKGKVKACMLGLGDGKNTWF